MKNELLLSDILKKADYKVTESRLAVLEFLTKAKQPQSIEEIKKALKDKADKVTLYRMLESFKKSGIVKQIDFQEGYALFELVDSTHDHHHIVCTNCKKVKDFTGCESEKVIQKALEQVSEFAIITNHSFELFGLCKSCSRK